MQPHHPRPRLEPVCLCLAVALVIGFRPRPAPAEIFHEPVTVSSGGRANELQQRHPLRGPVGPLEPTPSLIGPESFAIGGILEAYSFLDNPTLNSGAYFVPPDPIGAPGLERLLAIVNAGIECRDKAGTLQWRTSLRSFFSSLSGTLGTTCFDPKIVYDHYENRFVVVALEQTSAAGGSADDSRVLVAVSKDAFPNGAGTSQWSYLAINSKIQIGGAFYWADYPGLEVDEEAVYITANLFRFSTNGAGGVRLWIVTKGVSGGFYGGGLAAVSVNNPYAGGGAAITTMPALVFGAGGAGPGIGTYLVGYDGLTHGGVGGQEMVQIVRVNNPTTTPTFTIETRDIGDLENYGGSFGNPPLPDAPQLGSATAISVNDRRALDAVWRQNALWLVFEINPNATDPANAGETTAHWLCLNTSAVTSSASPAGLITVADQGSLGGEDLASGSTTFFPSVAVNSAGDAQFGFSASGATFYAGAYMAGRHAGDPAGTVRGSRVVHAGQDFYVRMFGGDTENRWGDFSGIGVDPFDDRIFWVFNQYAWTRGTTGVGTGDGRWKTAWRATAASCVNVGCPPGGSYHGGDPLALSFCITNCGALQETYSYTLSDDHGWCASVSSSVPVPAGGTVCVNKNCAVPAQACAPDSTTFHFQATSSTGEVASCATTIHALPCAVGPKVEVVPSAVLFPSVALGDTMCRRISVRNIGDQNLAISSVTGCNAGQFFLDLTALSAIVLPSDSTSFRVCFAPTHGGADSCQVIVATNDVNAIIPVHVGTVTAVAEEGGRVGLQLRVVPNPVSGSARIRFQISAEGRVRVDVFDATGRRVRRIWDGDLSSGEHEVEWNGADARGGFAGRGIYFVRIDVAGSRAVARMVKLE
jgi:flagellar hook capping protein FlgD